MAAAVDGSPAASRRAPEFAWTHGCNQGLPLQVRHHALRSLLVSLVSSAFLAFLRGCRWARLAMIYGACGHTAVVPVLLPIAESQCGLSEAGPGAIPYFGVIGGTESLGILDGSPHMRQNSFNKHHSCREVGLCSAQPRNYVCSGALGWQTKIREGQTLG